MRYPSPEEYMKAVQRRESFTTDELRGAELVVHPLYQIPMPAAGTSAVVFKAEIAGEPQALRFFTRDDSWSSERYDALHDHFTASGLAEVVAMPRWVHDGIRVNGQTWPVVRMQWIDGHTLNKHVEGLVQGLDTRSLSTLAEEWLELVVNLQRAEFAHGDLQHGNVLVDAGGRMHLVDFDCSWIARFSGWPPPSETGHRNYQPQLRPWGRWMDTFSGLVIYTSLLALSRNPTPWHVLNTGENLLFRREDFQPPYASATWAHLSGLGDRRVDELARRLLECCVPGWSATAGLGDLLAPRVLPWWDRAQLAAAGMGAAAPAGAGVPAGPGTPVGHAPTGPAPAGPAPAGSVPAGTVPAGSGAHAGPGAAGGPGMPAGAAGPGGRGAGSGVPAGSGATAWPRGAAPYAADPGSRAGAPPPRQAGATWWQEKSARGGRGPVAGRPAGRVGPAMAAALGLGALLTVLIMAVGGFDDDVAGPAVAIGFVVTILGGIVAVAATRKT